MKTGKKTEIFNSITFRITSIILLVLLLGIGFTIAYFLRSQNATIIESKTQIINEESDIIYTAIKNNMLAGEAPIAVELFRDFERSNFASNIKLYRSNGVVAFVDDQTIKTVNNNIEEERFRLTPRNVVFDEIKDSNFKKSVDTVDDIFIKDVDGYSKKLLIYKPLINQPKCSVCHGIDHVVRGVIRISAPVDEVYLRARTNIIHSAIIYAIVVVILTGVIFVFIDRVVISRILKIGNVVEAVGEGNFRIKVKVVSRDEIGALANRINSMIDGLSERFKLSKFVSKSTLDHVKQDEDLKLGGEKKVMTVLFSDIRGFTTYSERMDPSVVMEKLNRVMHLQSEIINEHGGDVDKFVGDEMISVFEGDDMVMRAIKAADKIRSALKKMNETEEYPFFVGIGINTGEMISGNMGSERRIDRTVIGDHVNLGSRLCSMAGKFTILISEYSYEYVKDLIEVNEHGPISVKGKEQKVNIFSLRNMI